jgi:hypothetical protein
VLEGCSSSLLQRMPGVSLLRRGWDQPALKVGYEDNSCIVTCKSVRLLVICSCPRAKKF